HVIADVRQCQRGRCWMAPRCLVMSSSVNKQIQMQLPFHRSNPPICTRVLLRPCPQLFVEPDRRQILVDVMAGADLEAFDIASIWHDAITPKQEGFMRLCIEHALLKLTH